MKYILVLIGSVFFGVAAGFAPVQAVILFGLLAGPALLFLIGANTAIWITIIVCFVLVGPLESRLQVPKVFWATYLLGLFLFGLAILQFVKAKSTPQKSVGSPQFHVVPVIVGLLVSSIVFGSMAAKADIVQLALGSRDYVWLWGYMLLILASGISIDRQLQWIRFLPWVVVLQMPLVVYQHFFIAKSTRFTTHDAIVGLFGGNPEGGGASGAMGFFSLLMALYMIGRMKSGCASRLSTFLVVSSALICIGLAEVKYVAMAVPIVVVAFFGVGAIFKSAKTLVLAMALIFSGPLILYGYSNIFTEPGARGYGSFEAYVTVMIENNLTPQDINPRTGEMGRVAAIKFWASKNSLAKEPVETLFGHGIGASRIGIFPGEVAKRYPFTIARSTMAVMLWEIGVVGLTCVVLLLLAWLAKARRLLRSSIGQQGETKAILQLTSAALVAALLSIPYNTDLIGTPQFQLLIIILITALVTLTRAAWAARITRPSSRLPLPKLDLAAR